MSDSTETEVPPTVDRRQFLAAAAAACVVPILAHAQEKDVAPRARSARSVYVDAQGNPSGIDEPESGRYVLTEPQVAAIRERRVDVISTTVGAVGNVPDAFRIATSSLAGWNTLLAAVPQHLAKIERTADIAAAIDAGKLGVIYNFQDTTALETNADNVDTFAALGVRVMQLTYNKRNLAGDGCLERSNAGLSDFGREIIARINKAKVLLDLSHAGQRTIAEGIAASTAPATISHSGCRSLVDLPRNTYDAEMRALAKKGGVFGIYLMPFLRIGAAPRAEDLIRHLEHAVNVCGEDHVGIGTDGWSMGYPITDKSRAEHREFYENRAKRGIAAPGESPEVLNLVEDYNDAARYDRLAQDLRRQGWSTTRVEKVLGNNFVRLFGEVWPS